MVLPNDEEPSVGEGIPSPSEMNEEQEQAQLHLQTKQALAAIAVAMKSALGVEDGEGGKQADLRRVAEQLGLGRADLEANPEAIKAALQHFIDEAQAMVEAAGSQARDFQAMRERLAARNIDLGETLDELPHHLEHIQQLDKESLARTAAAVLGVLIDAVKEDQALTGRRIDELIARLEQEIEPLTATNREREKQRQKEYRRSAASAISASLSAAGITPLTSPEGD